MGSLIIMSRIFLGLSVAATIALSGCLLNNSKSSRFKPGTTSSAAGLSQLKLSDAVPSANMPYYLEANSPLEFDENNLSADKIRPMTLNDCIAQALSSSRVMKDLGVTVVRSPQSVTTNLDPALVYTDPRLGEEAALSAFDANLFASSMYEDNDRGLNNRFFGVDGNLRQDLSTSQLGINKRSATGGLFGVRNVTIYDRNNQQTNRFVPFSWENYLEAQVRQPLLQGAGTEFNRIAGPGSAPGQFNGVLLARIRTDTNLVEFEKSVRDYLADVENAYWDLYYAYRDLDARIQARDIAKQTLEDLKVKLASTGRQAQAEEQVFRFQSEIVDSLNGRVIDGTRNNNGSTGGTFRGIGGIRVSERKLRFICGMPINDGTLISTADTANQARVLYDWDEAIQEALSQREELRRQRWVIKQRELELIASRNFLKPQLDMVSQYRMRGFGEDLYGTQSATSTFGQYQEWQLGLEYQIPVGFRRANAGVKNAELALVRESEVLREQERAVHFGLSNAINESKRAHDNLVLQEKRLNSIVAQLNAIDLRNESGEAAELDVRLETHRRLLDARLRFHQAEVEHMLALRNVNVEKGTLLRYCNVFLNESATSAEAASDAIQRIASQDYSKVPASRDVVVGSQAR